MNKTFPYSYIRGKVCKTAEAVIPIQSKVVQYGLGCFAGIRGNWNSKQKNLFMFRLKDHFIRMKNGAKIVGMKLAMTWPQFEKLIKELVKKNKVKEDIYIRPILYAGSTQVVPIFHDLSEDLAIYFASLNNYFDAEKGVTLCVSSWRRFDDDVMSTKAKLSGGYVNSALAKSEAKRLGYDDAIFLNRDGKVCECSSSNFFGIKNGVLITPPESSNILAGITRRSAMELARAELGMEVREEAFDRSTLYTFDEVFLTGTAAKLTFVSAIDDRKIGNGKMGKVTRKLKELFEKASVGELAGYENWCVKAY